MSWRSGANIGSHFCQIEGMRVPIFTMRRNALQQARITQVSGTPGAHIPHYSGCVRRRLKSRDPDTRISGRSAWDFAPLFWGFRGVCTAGPVVFYAYIFYVFRHNFKYLTTCLVYGNAHHFFGPSARGISHHFFRCQLMRALPVISITRVCAGILPKTKNATPCAA